MPHKIWISSSSEDHQQSVVETQQDDVWDRTTIGRLTSRQIHFTQKETLIQILEQNGHLLPQADVTSRSQYLDRETLERLVHLVRQACR